MNSYEDVVNAYHSPDKHKLRVIVKWASHLECKYEIEWYGIEEFLNKYSYVTYASMVKDHNLSLRIVNMDYIFSNMFLGNSTIYERNGDM